MSYLSDVYAGKKIILTGHTGFKGSWLSLWLKALGAHVVGLSLDVPSEPSHFDAANIQDHIDDNRIDIRKPKDINDRFILHCSSFGYIP